MPESSRRTDAPLSRALELAREALEAEPSGLLTDFDGTLSPIAADPSLARLVDGASGALASLVSRLAVVAVITGRAPLDARALTGVPGLLIVGNHGTEWLEPGEDAPLRAAEASMIQDRLASLLARLPDADGVLVERKGISATVHYRHAPEPDAALRQIVEALGSLEGSGVELRHGRMSVELRPVGLGDKGTAARAVVERFGLRGVIVMGDDLTDLDMFAAIAQLRDDGRVRGALIGVGGADRELPPEVAAAADAVLESPESAALFLADLAER